MALSLPIIALLKSIFLTDTENIFLALQPGEQGWDGTYNGEDMPSNDYWYRIEMIDGEIVPWHFTLKR